jgi:hypothetical protein
VTGLCQIGNSDSLAFLQFSGHCSKFLLPLRKKHSHVLAPFKRPDDDTQVATFAHMLLGEAHERAAQLSDARPFFSLQRPGKN